MVAGHAYVEYEDHLQVNRNVVLLEEVNGGAIPLASSWPRLLSMLPIILRQPYLSFPRPEEQQGKLSLLHESESHGAKQDGLNTHYSYNRHGTEPQLRYQVEIGVNMYASHLAKE